jgi:hypothetical protein
MAICWPALASAGQGKIPGQVTALLPMQRPARECARGMRDGCAPCSYNFSASRRLPHTGLTPSRGYTACSSITRGRWAFSLRSRLNSARAHHNGSGLVRQTATWNAYTVPFRPSVRRFGSVTNLFDCDPVRQECGDSIWQDRLFNSEIATAQSNCDCQAALTIGTDSAPAIV